MDKKLLKITMLFVLLGALHVGLVGGVGIDLLGTIFGTGVVSKLVYILIGVSALLIFTTDYTKKIIK